jgi:hypothetical protein
MANKTSGYRSVPPAADLRIEAWHWIEHPTGWSIKKYRSGGCV